MFNDAIFEGMTHTLMKVRNLTPEQRGRFWKQLRSSSYCAPARQEAPSNWKASDDVVAADHALRKVK